VNEHDANDDERTLPADTDETGAIHAAPMAAWNPTPESGDPGAPTATAEPAATTTEPMSEPAKPKSRTRRVLTLGIAATVLLTIGAGGGAIAAINLENGQQTTAANLGGGTSTNGSANGFQGGTGNGFDPSTGTGGRGSFGGFSQGGTSGGSSSSTSTGTGTAATAAQTVGVVTIVSTLGYESGEAAGTGIILTSSGRILTNNHVIDGATALKVTDETTGKTYTAKVVGTDATDDVAVLQLEGASVLKTATLATGNAAVGDAVTAVGNAGGTGTLSAAKGSVTALDQSITTAAEGSSASEKLTGLIETDADVVSGDSGGPLKDSSGAVIGIDTAASSGSSDVTGYAIPIAAATAIADEIVAGKDTADITLGYPAFLGVAPSDGSSSAGGATIDQIISGTPAASSGLAEGDVITAVDGHAIASAAALSARLGSYSPGDSVKITYTDTDGDSHSVQVTLATGPAN
jgi:S1-C subfamily serine protease